MADAEAADLERRAHASRSRALTDALGDRDGIRSGELRAVRRRGRARHASPKADPHNAFTS